MSNSTAPTHIPVTKLWTESFKRTWKDWSFTWSFTGVYLLVAIITSILLMLALALCATPVVLVAMATESEMATIAVGIPFAVVFGILTALVTWLLDAFLAGGIVGVLRVRKPGMKTLFKTVWTHAKSNFALFRKARRLLFWVYAIAFVLIALFLGAMAMLVVGAESGNIGASEDDAAAIVVVLLILFYGPIMLFSLFSYVLQIGISYASYAALKGGIAIPRQSTKVGFGFFKRNFGASIGAFALMMVAGMIFGIGYNILSFVAQIIAIVPVVGWLISIVLFLMLCVVGLVYAAFVMIWGEDLKMRLYQDRQPNTELIPADILKSEA